MEQLDARDLDLHDIAYMFDRKKLTKVFLVVLDERGETHQLAFSQIEDLLSSQS